MYKEIKYNLDYNSIFVSLSNYLFSEKLKQNKIDIKKSSTGLKINVSIRGELWI